MGWNYKSILIIFLILLRQIRLNFSHKVQAFWQVYCISIHIFDIFSNVSLKYIYLIINHQKRTDIWVCYYFKVFAIVSVINLFHLLCYFNFFSLSMNFYNFSLCETVLKSMKILLTQALESWYYNNKSPHIATFIVFNLKSHTLRILHTTTILVLGIQGCFTIYKLICLTMYIVKKRKYTIFSVDTSP